MAANALTTGAPVRASGKLNDISAPAPTRRAMLGFAAGAAVISLPVAVSATTMWQPLDWLDRWSKLACGARLDQQGHLQLTPRSEVVEEAAAMLAELAPIGRLDAVKHVLERSGLYKTCPALSAVQQMHAIDAEYVNGDDDPEGEAAWLERWCAARRRLRYSPARTSRGLAAKLREGIESIDTPEGDAIIADALRQLEHWS